MEFEKLQYGYDSDKKHRRSIRLKGYDYSSPGYYFITICIQDHRHLLGQIADGKMILNPAGKIVEKWYHKIFLKFEYAVVDTYVIMPNHSHAIIQIRDPVDNRSFYDQDMQFEQEIPENKDKLPSLPDVVQWFKTMTTNDYIHGVKEYNWPAFWKRYWQRNYYEHIIRKGEDLSAIREYIQGNPANWGTDIMNS